jgi:tetratricopeptide (TPR) repeat protein
LGGALLLVLGMTLLRPSGPPAIPFLAVGAIRTPELGDTSSLGPVLRDMLATSLGGLEGLQVVANSRLVELTPPALENQGGAMADAARRAGATEIIEGELASAGGVLVLTLRRVDLARGMVRKGYLVRAAERYALVDSAAATVARDLGLASPSVGVRDVRTGSAEAYVLYNEALRAYFSFDGPGGLRLMQAALEQDSTFAMAAYYAWIIGEYHGDGPTNARAFERIKRLAPRTIERERLLIQADVAIREAPLSVAAAIAETLTVRYPTDPDGHILLGRVRVGQADYLGAAGAFERAVTIDSAAGTTGPYCRMCLAMSSLIHTYLWWDSAGAAERTGRRIIAHRPGERKNWNSLVEPLLRQGRRAEAEAALERSGILDLAFAYYTGMLHRDLLRWGRLEELDRELRSDLRSPSLEARDEAHWLLLLSLRDQGRLREVRELVREHQPPALAHQGLGFSAQLVLSSTLLEGMGRPDSAARLLHADARRILESPDPSVPVVRARNATWLLALASTAYVASGDTAVVRRLADSIEVIGKGSGSGRDTRMHHYLRGILLQRAGRHAEAVDQLRRSVSSLTDGYTVINLAMARSLLELRRPAEAIAVLRPAIRGGVDGTNTYTSRTELHEAMAQAFEQAGQRDSAVAHYRAVEQNWRRADPEFSERYRRAKAAAGM